MEKTPTPHISASKNEFAKIVLMPGDPLRAKFIAENFLENVRLVNSVRGMLGYTGTYKGKEVSVMGHGMGIPSIGIYSYELFAFYDVDLIIRVGSCGSFQKELNLGDIIIANQAISDSTYAKSMNFSIKSKTIDSTPAITALSEEVAKNLRINFKKGLVLSSDAFYGSHNSKKISKKIKSKKLLAVEMEAFALYVNARKLNKEALTILTVSDSLVTDEKMDSNQRQIGFSQMITLALEIANQRK